MIVQCSDRRVFTNFRCWWQRWRLVIVVLYALVMMPAVVFAFEELNPVQSLVYDSAHLANTSASQVVGYHYSFRDGASDEMIEDEVRLVVKNKRDSERRDVSVEFLSDDRRIVLPNFDNYRGNPVVIAMLEHLAQTMGRDTGGGALYFRNRIRDSLASDSVKLVEGVKDESVESLYPYSDYSEFTLQPFVGDPFLIERPEYTQAKITMRFSDAVPGRLVFVKLLSGPPDNPKVTRELAVDASKNK